MSGNDNVFKKPSLIVIASNLAGGVRQKKKEYFEEIKATTALSSVIKEVKATTKSIEELEGEERSIPLQNKLSSLTSLTDLEEVIKLSEQLKLRMRFSPDAAVKAHDVSRERTKALLD